MKEQTLAIHHGYEKDGQKTMAVPLYQTTAYQFDSLQHAANLFELKELGNIYTRLNNPTTAVFEARVAALEEGAAALAVASGMSSIFYAIANVAEAGDNIIAASKLYGGTVTLFGHTIKRFGIESRFFDIDKPEEIEKLIDSKTKAIFFETITNPSIDVPNFEKIVAIAKKHGILTIVDNTVATPILCKPLTHGVDVVVHSASKYMTGQGLAIGGVIVERDGIGDIIASNPRYPQFNEPDESYHGLVYTAVPLPMFTLRARLSLLRDLGAAIAPFNSWLFIQGLETLALRMKEHSANALAVATFLEAHPKVLKVNYPGLKSHKNHDNATRYLKNSMASGLLSFEVATREDAEKIVNNVKLFSLVVNIGDSKSIITHPASTTHQQLSSEELKACGIAQGLVRLSVGIEDCDDLINDLKSALSTLG